MNKQNVRKQWSKWYKEKMDKQVYIYFDPQNPEFCKKMTAKYGKDWNVDDFENDTSDDFITHSASAIRIPRLSKKVQ